MYHGIILTEAANPIRIKTLGAYTIANVLREQGLNILVIDMFSQVEENKLYALLEKSISAETLFVGYSGSLFLTLSPDGHENLFPGGQALFQRINAKIKSLNANTKILFGGSPANRIWATIVEQQQSLGLDYVFFGYSDHMIRDFVERLRANRVQQVSKRAHGVGLIDYDSRGDLYPFRNNNHRWHDHDFVLPGEALPLEVARGCIFKCKFCSFPLLGKHKQDDSYTRLEENILGEVLDNHARWGTTTYFVVDDTFNERTSKLEMLARVRDRSKIDLNFSGFLRLDLVARLPGQLELLVDLNFRGLYFGIESLNYESAKSIGKSIQPSEVKDWLYKIHESFDYNTMIQAGFIVGLPHETEDTFREWAEWAISDQSPINLNDFSALYLSSSSHSESEFLRNPEQYGYRYVGGVRNSKWVNDHWDWQRCHRLAKEYESRAFNSGRSRVGSLVAPGLVKLGYDFNKLSSYSLRDLFAGELQYKIARYRNDYFNRLNNYLSGG